MNTIIKANKDLLGIWDSRIKTLGWKSTAGLSYKMINRETISFFTKPFYNTDILRAQIGTSNILLDKIVWRIYGLLSTFGSVKNHIAGSTKCTLNIAHDAIEFPSSLSDPIVLAKNVTDFAEIKSNSLSSIDDIYQTIMDIDLKDSSRYDIELLCIAIYRNDFVSANDIVKRNSINNPGFDLSIFSKARDLLDNS